MNTTLAPPRVMPNPALRGGELQLAAMQGAKQARYAAMRQAHTAAWFISEKNWKQTFNALQMWCWIRRVAL